MTIPDEFQLAVNQFLKSRNHELISHLGTGTQGTVYLVNNPSRLSPHAVKFHNRKIAYERELAVFLRLKDLEINDVRGHSIPDLIGYDDELLAIEMTIVSPPFCLDFGGAYLDRPPDYTPEVWRDWEEMKSMAFEENWPAVKKILSTFEAFGIYIADVNPGNIKFS
ncbi:hypothetical protein [Mariniblastus fucicola]|uniref:Aminoglycoside phosphotransferase domain-containing protein n=1 Tax=Mariniblastus fucicola TaxID=980251 RepID=A0A5B9PKI4_9BACT|nr:hypothetical protein [Mariniblastus fucicola]QEG25232.1 hypothetical protein MFFC18_51560 [Mariniblastus fucicola]